MKIFYADDTYAKSDQEDKVSRIHILGGIIIPKKQEGELIDIIRTEKSKYTHANLPMKWNFKDNKIKDKFEQYSRTGEYKEMLIASNIWRKNIIQNSLNLDYKIICSVIENYSEKKDVIIGLREDLIKYSFENILLRLGMDAANRSYETLIIMDWPPSENPRPYLEAYYKLYHTGKSSGNVVLTSSLSESNFFHSLLFAKCNHSPLLQFSDLIIGSLKDCIESKLFNKKNDFAVEMFNIYKGKFRSRNGKIIGYGLLPPTGNKDFKEKLEKLI